MTEGPASVEATTRTGRREVVRFAGGTVAFLVVVAVAVLGALPVTAVVAYVVTAGITGWRGPGPDIIQGCEKSLTCSESATFFPAWGFAFVAHLLVGLLVFRAVLNGLAPKQRLHRG